MSEILARFVQFLGRRMLSKLRRAMRLSVTAAAMLFAFICADGKLSRTGFEQGVEEIAAVVQVAQPVQAKPRHGSEPVYTAHHHVRDLKVVRSISERDSNPLDGHFLPNGLNAPLRS